jgi:4-carboxymuconolactone decarboxylase
MNDQDHHEQALATAERLLGHPLVLPLAPAEPASGADFRRLATVHTFGDSWARSALDDRSRALVSVAITAALGTREPLRGQLRIALNSGISKVTFAANALPVGSITRRGVVMIATPVGVTRKPESAAEQRMVEGAGTAVPGAALSQEIAEHSGRLARAATDTTSGDLMCRVWRRLRGSSPAASAVSLWPAGAGGRRLGGQQLAGSWVVG